MSTTLLIRLSGDVEDATQVLRESFGARKVLVRSLADVLSLRGVKNGFFQIAFLGEPPSDEIGFAFSPFIALLLRPERVLTIDTQKKTVRTQGRRSFVGQNAGRALSHLLTSSAAVGLQRSVVEVLQMAGAPMRPATASELRRVLYLHPHVGV